MNGVFIYVGALAGSLLTWALIRPVNANAYLEYDITGTKRPAPQQRLRTALISAPFVLVSGLRWRVGEDYDNYARNYAHYVEEFRTSFALYDEPGIRMVAFVASVIHDDSATFFLLAAAATIGIAVYVILQRSPMVALSLTLFVLTGFWHGTFNAVRQYLACAILLIAHRYIIERKPVVYTAWVALAALFHVSAIVALTFYFVPQKRLGVGALAGLVVVSLAAGTAADWFLTLIGEISKENLAGLAYVERQVNPLRVALALIPVVVYFLLPKPDFGDKFTTFYVNMVFVNSAVWLASAPSAYLARFAVYTNVILVLAIPLLLSASSRSTRVYMGTLLVLLYGTFWFLEVSNSPTLANFQWIFQRSWHGTSAGRVFV